MSRIGDPIPSDVRDAVWRGETSTGFTCEACGQTEFGGLANPRIGIERVGGSACRIVHLGCLGERACRVRCSPNCGLVFHPATGFLVGWPTQYRACGPCAHELLSQLSVDSHKRVRGYQFYDHIVRPGPDVKPAPKRRPGRHERAGTPKKTFVDLGASFKKGD